MAQKLALSQMKVRDSSRRSLVTANRQAVLERSAPLTASDWQQPIHRGCSGQVISDSLIDFFNLDLTCSP